MSGSPNICSAQPGVRSEEHTSELQSQSNLVCRLLLEKKKHINRTQLLLHPVLYVALSPAPPGILVSPASLAFTCGVSAHPSSQPSSAWVTCKVLLRV